MNSKKSEQKKKKTSLSEAFKELEAIAAKFEDGEIDLEKGISELEKGLKLASFLKKELSDMEHKVVKIKKSYQKIDG